LVRSGHRRGGSSDVSFLDAANIARRDDMAMRWVGSAVRTGVLL
jgi:hypothetical protein